MKRLIDFKAPRERFARSVNVERDAGTNAIDGYLPVGRAIDSVERLAGAILSEGEVALSITGPYGTGKSSLALLLDSLFAPSADNARRSADELLLAAAPEVMSSVENARRRAKADRSGFVRAVVTAQREPVARTVLRALHHGLARYKPPAKLSAKFDQLEGEVEALSTGLNKGDLTVQTRQIRELVHRISEFAPLLILIDEFGKNLEAFAESPGDSDLFLLQELAEWTRANDRHRVALVTLQHMAFGDYATGATGVERREWMKIQGRFEDVPFIDTPRQARALAAASFGDPAPALQRALTPWAEAHVAELRLLGLFELADDPRTLEQSWPLHPLALAVLPDLCHRYGQNERTMFSFLASREPLSVGRFLYEHRWASTVALPEVRLDRLYDYFIDSASNMVGVSADASRWIEIDTRIRDARGLTEMSRALLKAVGILNLTSTGGVLRASAEMLRYATRSAASQPNDVDYDEALADLVSRGLLTYRDFADEYRVWQGSDFDIKAALAHARRRTRDLRSDEVLSAVLPLTPVVAARHSHQTGTLRAFERTWVDGEAELAPLTATDRGDGLVAYVVGGSVGSVLPSEEHDKPIVVGEGETSRLVEAAREVLALQQLLADDDVVKQDWVVRKELAERSISAAVNAKREFEVAFGPLANVTWTWVNAGPVPPRELSGSLTTVVSAVADASYSQAIPLRNDLLSRHELSSQAAKARREVVEVMQARQHLEELGLSGFGPDRTLYRSLFSEFGMHRQHGERWMFTAPDRESPAFPVWSAVVRDVRAATAARMNVASLFDTMALPPYGLRAGVAPVLLVAVMCAHSDEFAMYEHGTFRPRLSPDVVERLLRNPGNFELKCYGTRSRSRQVFIRHLASELDGELRSSISPSVVSVVSSMVARLNMQTSYARKTRRLSDSTTALRSALLLATEPDELLFSLLPKAMGDVPVGTRDRRSDDEFQKLASEVADALRELEAVRSQLRTGIKTILATELKATGDVQSSLSHRSLEIKDRILDPRLKAMSTALQADMDESEWLDYVAMQVVGTPPDSWSDDEANRFEVTMHDLGASFLRVEALTADMRAVEGEFDAMRISVNSTRGGDLVRLVQLDDGRSAAVGRALAPALASLGEHGINDDEAREWILAHLLDTELKRVSGRVDVGGDAYGEGQAIGKENRA